METTSPLHAAEEVLQRLARGPVAPSLVAQARASLSPGECRLFDRAVALARRAAEDRALLERAARFAEAGLGTAALIHEIKQCLSPLLGTTALLREGGVRKATPELLADVIDQATRLAELIDRHLALFRDEVPQDATADVADAVAEAARYFEKLPPGVSLKVSIPPRLPHVAIHRPRLVHALVNLLANARDAHEEKPGVIDVGARAIDDRVEVTVSDQGPGVAPDVREKLFQPLVTTKGELGTGLGLFLTRSLLQPAAEVFLLDGPQATPGSRTTFVIRLRASGTAA